MKYIIATVFGGVLCLSLLAMAPRNAFAAAGDVQVTVTSELGTAIASAGITFQCSGGGAVTAVGQTNGSGVLTVASSSLNTGGQYVAAGCQYGGATLTVVATSSGYVSSSTSITDDKVGNPNTVTLNGVKYGLKVTAMTDEVANNIMPTSGVPFYATSSVLTISSQTYSSGAWYLVASSTSAAGAAIVATSSGYVYSTIFNVANSVSAQKTVAFDGNTADDYNGVALKHALKVTAIINELGTSIAPTTGTPFAGSSGLTMVSQVYSGGTWYVAASSTAAGGTLTATTSGYVDRAITSVITSTSTQKTVDFGDSATNSDYNGSALLYLLKVLTYDELGNALSGVSVSHGGTAESTAVTNTHYLTTTSAGAIGASLDGYVNFNSNIDTGLASVSTSHTAGQTVVTLSGTTAYTGSDPVGSTATGKGLVYGLKVTVIDSNGAAVSGATVTAGNSYGVSCSESGTTGVYYCAPTISDSGTSVKVVKTGYATQTANYTDRVAADNSQTAVTVTMGATSVSSGSGSSAASGSGYYYALPVVTAPSSACPTGYTCRLIGGGNNGTPGMPSSSAFIRRLMKGITGSDVHSLQILLNKDKDTQVTDTGAGSPGNETDFFGSMTMSAVQKFQVKYGIAKPGDEGYGFVGPNTRAKLNSLMH